MGAGAANPYAGEHWIASQPYTSGFAITTSDSTDLTKYARALYIGVAGDVKVDMIDGGTVVFKAVPVGILNVSAKRVYATGTAATNIIGLQ